MPLGIRDWAWGIRHGALGIGHGVATELSDGVPGCTVSLRRHGEIDFCIKPRRADLMETLAVKS